ncbi:RING-H2 finger protein ATL66-like [Tripterygium wilfordii]|uniref:RING-H2 finger protein ATL66-like n=1 Tax=Tripterygium wilfordii TaxID=458696 RepID=UPI0018F85A5E|nr:RING-H2 finger protein ATL66-like [Tripterygium wilfordii]
MARPSEVQQPLHWNFTDLIPTSFLHHLHSKSFFLMLVFFSLLILITTLSIYAHWVCRHKRRLSTTATTVAPSCSSSPGLNQATIDSLPVSLHRSSMEINIAEGECCICLSLLEDEDKVKVLPDCNHEYHSECVDKWLSTQSSCPLCRASLGAVNSLHDSAIP